MGCGRGGSGDGNGMVKDILSKRIEGEVNIGRNRVEDRGLTPCKKLGQTRRVETIFSSRAVGRTAVHDTQTWNARNLILRSRVILGERAVH